MAVGPPRFFGSFFEASMMPGSMNVLPFNLHEIGKPQIRRTSPRMGSGKDVSPSCESGLCGDMDGIPTSEASGPLPGLDQAPLLLMRRAPARIAMMTMAPIAM